MGGRIGNLPSGLAVLLLACATFASPAVVAEGRCPPGQFPVGGPGMLGCAPINGAAPAQSAPQPTGKWIDTWGAIAVSDASGDSGVSSGKLSRSDAVSEALQNCTAGGSADCKAQVTYKNQCVAVAKSSIATQEGVAYTGPEETVQAEALARCSRGGRHCQIKYVDCTKPIFQRF